MSTNSNRAQVVDLQFIQRVKSGQLPSVTSPSPENFGISRHQLIDLFESQVISRHLDFQARVLKTRNESFYTIGSSGHEGNAVLGMVFRYTDIAFLHYRSGAFMVQRSKQLAGSTPLYDGLLSLVASSEDPIAGGRHKVFGSVPLWVPPQTSTIASHLPKALGAAYSLPKAKSLQVQSLSPLPEDAIVLCSFGDASVNHSTAQGTLNSAAWCAFQNIPLPLVFVCEDNGIGISVPTPKNWVAASCSARPGIKYFHCNGLDLADTFFTCCEVEHYVRTTRRPAFLHMRVVRLLGHAGSDIETTYHSLEKIEELERQDPLLQSAAIILKNKYMSAEEILSLYESIRERVERVSKEVVLRPKLISIEAVQSTVIPPAWTHRPPYPYPPSASRQELFAGEISHHSTPQHMAKLINWALQDLMLQYPQILVFGEDVAKKGGVYYVTANLMKKFGEKRVFNSLLDEQTILGMAIGLAHNGFIPIPEIQFLAYLHNAEDQLRGEAATLSFFSQGQYTNPCIIRIPGLAYQKGFGGHFHNDNSLAVLRDIPGIIIACPSRGDDAVRMLRTCVRMAYEQRRVVVFIEPIALYMTKDLHEKGDGGWSFPYPDPDPKEVSEIPLGQFSVHREPPVSTNSGKLIPQTHMPHSLVIITYANGYYYSRQAARLLLPHVHGPIKVIDLRWIAPLDQENLLKEVATATHVLIVDECRRTGSLSEAIAALILTQNSPKKLPVVDILAATDCFIPLGVAATAGLPEAPQIVEAVLKMLKGVAVSTPSSMATSTVTALNEKEVVQ